MIFKYTEKKKPWSRSFLSTQGCVESRVYYALFPTQLSNKDWVWLENVKVTERCILTQGIFGNFYVYWKVLSRELA